MTSMTPAAPAIHLYCVCVCSHIWIARARESAVVPGLPVEADPHERCDRCGRPPLITEGVVLEDAS